MLCDGEKAFKQIVQCVLNDGDSAKFFLKQSKT